MKRLHLDEANKEATPTPGSIYRSPAISYSHSNSIKVGGESMQSGLYTPTPAVNYGSMPPTAAPHSGKPQAMQSLCVLPQMRTKGSSPPTAPPQGPPQQQSPTNNTFQRLKVEDALSYLDLVKFKFGAQPQVYNDFLDIMKEFKSQSIDTPGVIQRVSSLFRGFPDLIVGFNTFLPPGYKIEVQRSEQGYAVQVSVSMPSPTGTVTTDLQQKPAMIISGSGTIIHSSISQGTPNLPSSQSLPLTQHGPSVTPPQAAASVLHHLSGYGSGQIHNSTHAALTLSAAQAAVNQALQGHSDTPQNQPVEFNHAINYVNKIKNRFQGQPEKYKRFLEILHTYQKEQRTIKEAAPFLSNKHLTEQEVYSQVAKLFEHQGDLLAEFGQFLPDATNNSSPPPLSEHVANIAKKPPIKQPYRDHQLDRHMSHKPSHMSNQIKRSPPYSSLISRDGPPPKKHKMSSCRDVTLAEAGKYGTLNDYAFFDKVRKALRSPEVYNNFLRCLTLFNQEIISKSELVQLVTPFLGKFPELLRWFRDFLGQADVDPTQYNVPRVERPQGDHAIDIDLATAKRLGASYCVIPPSQELQKCSGRTQLCKDVLNDQWVSFPTWSEDSTFVSSRKTQYEEYMYRCEDERFELDVVIETNASTIRILEGVQKKLNRMSAEEISRYRLDDCLGGNSPVLHQRAIRRIYGDKAQDIIDGLKRSPSVAVPVVLRRLKTKEEEWTEAQKGFNKIWREQNEKYYLKSLDHQGINFKQTDVKALRSKSLYAEIEALSDERHDHNEDHAGDPVTGPHICIQYRDRTILDDAANLLIHHVKRQTGIQKGEKRRIKNILRQLIPDLFFHPRQQLSDDEREDDDEKEDAGNESPNSNSSLSDAKSKTEIKNSPKESPARVSPDGENGDTKSCTESADPKEDDTQVPIHAQVADPEEAYTLFITNCNWYIFLRLHAILCERLLKMYEHAVVLAREEMVERNNRKDSTAVALRLKPKPHIEVEDYYPAFLDMVKNLLDGNMDSNAFEDTLREMFGIHAYIAFTLDKVVQYSVRQLQHCVTEKIAIACMEIFQKEQKRGAGGPCATAHRRQHFELAYQRQIENLVQDDNCFKIFIYKRDCKLTLELLDAELEDSKKNQNSKKWSSYKDRFARSASTLKASRSPAYLNRNLKFRKGSLVCRNEQEPNKRLMQNGSNEPCSSSSNMEPENNDDPSNEADDKLNDTSSEGNIAKCTGYNVPDEETECKFNSSNTKATYTINKETFLYKYRAFKKAQSCHPSVTKRLAMRFRSWLKKWASVNISDNQQKQCTDWLMGRSEGVVPNRTRVITNNDLSRSPYSPYNRYRVERLGENPT